MPHPSQFKLRGGKKGPRQVNGKHQIKGKLRPAPARDPADLAKQHQLAGDENDDEGADDDAEPAFGYREALQPEDQPLEGLRVSVSGCDGEKEELLTLAVKYGAERHGGLQTDTTHLVVAQPGGKKYDVALQRRMHVMRPSWLRAVREAWMSGEQVDFRELELRHVMPPLAGCVVSLTGFARGEYKDAFKQLLSDNGAVVSSTLDSSVTYLVVASPSSPHSQTASSDKLLHARKHRNLLHPNFAVVWEGWAREAIKYGGVRAERTAAWNPELSPQEPPENVEFAVAQPAARSKALRSSRDRLADFELPTPHARATTQTRSLVPPERPGATARPAFKGYDALPYELDGQAEASPSKQPFDVAHGKVLKKKRRALGASTSSQLLSSDAQPLQPQQPAQDDSQALLEAFGAASQLPLDGSELSRFADADMSELPSLDEALAAIGKGKGRSSDAVEQETEEAPRETALELVAGQVEMQRVTKSKSVIKALSTSRKGSFVHETADRTKPLQQKHGISPVAEELDGAAHDDSAFFDSAPHISPDTLITLAPTAAPDKLPATRGNTTSSAPSSDDGPISPIFAGQRFALFELKGPPLEGVMQVITLRGGTCFVDPDDEELANVDWIVVDYAEPPARFNDSDDPRVVSICWLELCIFHDALVPPADRLLERPISYACPVPAFTSCIAHFSGFGPEDEPIVHHIKRFCTAIGATYSPYMDRSTTHLVVCALDDAPHLAPEDLNAVDFPKVAKAREWGLTISSLADFRRAVKAQANGSARSATPKVKSEAGRGREVREITNEVEERVREERAEDDESQGPLGDCVVFFSTKLDVDRLHLASIIQDLGGTAARQYSDAVTHLICAGSKANEPYREFKSAKANGAHIVHPRWIEEADFPHTFHARKGGQLFDTGMSMHIASSPRGSPMSRDNSRDGALPRSPSKLSLGSPRMSPSARATDAAAEPQCRTSPSPESPTAPRRRRRSDTTATEIADTSDFHPRTRLSPVPGSVAPAAASSSPPAPPVVAVQKASSQPDPSSDALDLPLLPSERQLSPPPEDPNRNMLREQTSLLLAQLNEAAQGQPLEKQGRTRSRTALSRGKSSGTISLTTSKHPSPVDGPPHPVDGSTTTSRARIPGQAYPLEPSQATQDDESMYVVYDNLHEAAAREQIRQALAAGGGDSAQQQQQQTQFQDPVGTRTRRGVATRRTGMQ
ncbi:hypothetical protein Rhopal_007515-T1 [Rhodotorula paludigena]|uniref:BRCT domain-containing protein n=1 Tax=Rhodotorula paludigena TaxID=86838 RepID=A0AAV5GWU5_9BASI|nr:hypothetical protein Rhopal_007515-T1 [Rhodotorula paludigena]